MPYADPEQQRAAKAASARRRRAAHRGTVEPAVAVPMPTREDLRAAGAVLNCGRSVGESDDAYRARLRLAWQGLLTVVAE